MAVCILLCISVVASASNEKRVVLSQMMLQSLKSYHLMPQDLDDAYSKRVFDLFMERLDPNKRFFTRKDIQILDDYQYEIDDQLEDGEFKLFDLAMTRFRARVNLVQSYVTDILNEEMVFDTTEMLELDAKERRYVSSDNELRVLWQQLVKWRIIQNYLALYNDKYGPKEEQTLQDVQFPAFKVEEELLTEAKEKATKSFERIFTRLGALEEKDLFNRFMDTLAQSHDAHTTFFPPAEKENFDIGMTGRLEGIGAVLREEDGYIKVVRIIPGSASWRQKQLKAEDIILKVAQGDGEPVDIVEVPVRDAVKLIRGKKGTEVRLSVKKPDGQVVVIPIIRDIVVVEETFAKSAIIERSGVDKKIGYIYLPGFYRDFKNKKERNATDDIRRILFDLKQKNVSGVILDLRNNGGGALEDAVLTSGHFISSGPIVHVVTKSKRSRVLRDMDPSIIYDGPLIILVNQFSASASEILAAAMQDYGRAVIVGTKASFGKGTVQAVINLDNYLPRHYAGYKPLGSVKLTIQKFFRVNGRSTQYDGVVPDIILPSSMDYVEVGERTLDFSQRWRPVKELSYSKWPKKPNITKLKRESEKRVQNTSHFKDISEYVEMVTERNESKQTLNMNSAWSERLSIRHVSERLENEEEVMKNISVTILEPKSKGEADKVTRDDFTKGIKKDIILSEVMNIMNDMVEDYDSRYPKRHTATSL